MNMSAALGPLATNMSAALEPLATNITTSALMDYSVYSTQYIYDGLALRWLDLVFAVLYILCLLQAIVGNVLILFLLLRYRPYIRSV